jgi:predicted RNase H-like HicB family nuclease
MIEYAVILERGDRNWSAYVPDLPGCVAGAKTREETQKLIQEAIALHVQLLREHGEPVPEPTSFATSAAIPA